MQLNRFVLTQKAVKFAVLINPSTENGGTGDGSAEEERKVSAQEEPLPELERSLEALVAPFIEIMALPSSYREGLTVYGFSVSHTKHGTRAVQLLAKKALHTIGGNLHTIEAPYAKIDLPADGESGEQQVSQSAAEAIENAITEATRYVQGERSQQLLDFDTAKKGLQAVADKGEEAEPALL